MESPRPPEPNPKDEAQAQGALLRAAAQGSRSPVIRPIERARAHPHARAHPLLAQARELRGVVEPLPWSEPSQPEERPASPEPRAPAKPGAGDPWAPRPAVWAQALAIPAVGANLGLARSPPDRRRADRGAVWGPARAGRSAPPAAAPHPSTSPLRAPSAAHRRRAGDWRRLGLGGRQWRAPDPPRLPPSAASRSTGRAGACRRRVRPRSAGSRGGSSGDHAHDPGRPGANAARASERTYHSPDPDDATLGSPRSCASSAAPRAVSWCRGPPRQRSAGRFHRRRCSSTCGR
jgi:hypothetical protein